MTEQLEIKIHFIESSYEQWHGKDGKKEPPYSRTALTKKKAPITTIFQGSLYKHNSKGITTCEGVHIIIENESKRKHILTYKHLQELHDILTDLRLNNSYLNLSRLKHLASINVNAYFEREQCVGISQQK